MAGAATSDWLPILYAKSLGVDLLAVTSAYRAWAATRSAAEATPAGSAQRAQAMAAARAVADAEHRAAAAALGDALAGAGAVDAMEGLRRAGGFVRVTGDTVDVAAGALVVAPDTAAVDGTTAVAARGAPAPPASYANEAAYVATRLLTNATTFASALVAAAAERGEGAGGGGAAAADAIARARRSAARRERRGARSPAALPPAPPSAAEAYARVVASPSASPRGAMPGRGGGAAARGADAPPPFGTLTPQHPLLRPVVLAAPGLAFGSLLPNEAQQHLTLTQADGTEPRWRGAEREALVRSHFIRCAAHVVSHTLLTVKVSAVSLGRDNDVDKVRYL